MFDRARLTPFTQSVDSCCLASYAVSLASASQHPVTDFFDSYCAHFKIATAGDAERAYETDFKGRIATMFGLRIIQELHESSTAAAFTAARRVARVRHVTNLSANELVGIDFVTKQLDAVACVALGDGIHCVAVGEDAAGVWSADTAKTPMIGTRGPATKFVGAADALLILF